jgi:hydrogenase-4 component F
VRRAGAFDPALLDFAFVFLLLGYGTKVGLAPLHAWLPDAHAEGPTPISAVLSGLLLNIALYALLRFKMLLAPTPALAPGPLMVTLGLLSLDLRRVHALPPPRHQASVRLFVDRAHGHHHLRLRHGRPDRQFCWPVAHDHAQLTKSAIFFTVGHIAQVKGTQRIADMGGLTVTHPMLGWGLILGVVAIAGLPPLGIFISEFLVVTSTFARAPLLAIILVFGILVALAGLFLRLNSIAFGEPRGPSAKAQASYVPMFAHLALVLVAGIYIPPALVAWFQNVARLLG